MTAWPSQVSDPVLHLARFSVADRGIVEDVLSNSLTNTLRPARSPRLTGRSGGTRRSGWRSVSAISAALACLLALTACGPQTPRDPAAAVLEDDGTYRVEVLMKDMAFDPAQITVPDGARLVLEVENIDSMPHDLVLEDGRTTELLSRGGKQTVDVGVVDNQLDGWCAVSGHRAAGMLITING